jgi:CBS domain-containing protein
MKGITLFIFGGVAEMDEEPPSAKSEFWMAFVGPVSSVVLGGIFYAADAIIHPRAPGPVQGILLYLAVANVILAGFNLLPAFPLDGGRVLRSILWSLKKDLLWATRVSSGIGSVFGILLIIFGLFSVFNGDVVGGIWWFLIGMFLKQSAAASYQQLLARRALEGEKVERFMIPNPVSVPPSLSLGQLIRDYVYRYHYKTFPVVGSSGPVGCISLGQVKDVPKKEWDQHTVAEYLSGNSPQNTIRPETDAVEALSVMNRSGNTRLMVVRDGKLVGIVSLRDLLKFLSIKLELEKTKTFALRPGTGHQA